MSRDMEEGFVNDMKKRKAKKASRYWAFGLAAGLAYGSVFGLVYGFILSLIFLLILRLVSPSAFALLSGMIAGLFLGWAVLFTMLNMSVIYTAQLGSPRLPLAILLGSSILTIGLLGIGYVVVKEARG